MYLGDKFGWLFSAPFVNLLQLYPLGYLEDLLQQWLQRRQVWQEQEQSLKSRNH